MNPGNGKSLAEPALATLQRRAIRFLQDQARHAHYVGDGFLVNHLCALALQRVNHGKEKNELAVPLRHTFWAMTLALYWLVDEYMLNSVEKALKAYREPVAEDAGLFEVVNVVADLVREPFNPAGEACEKLFDVNLKWLDDENRCEGLALVTFCVELIWQRDPSAAHWRKLADRWMNVISNTLKPDLERFYIRLRLQTGIVCPEAGRREPPQGDVFWDSVDASLYKVWKQYLKCEWSRMDDTLASVVPVIPYDSPRFEALCGLRDLHLSTNPNWRQTPSEDPVDVRATRWNLKAASGGPSTFRQVRRERFGRRLAEFWRTGPKKVPGFRRIHGFRLGMMDQIAALREWDAYAWNLATGQLADAHMAVARMDPSETELVAGGLRMAVQSRSFDENDPVFQGPLYSLDFAPVEQRVRLVRGLLRVWPVESFKALQVLEKLSDSVPENLLPSLARWCLDYVKFPGDRPGWTIHPLSFWAHIIPYVEDAPRICRGLHPALAEIANHPLVWMSDKEDMLTEFLSHAPLDSATDIAAAIMGEDIQDEKTNRQRWGLVFNSVMRRRDPAFTKTAQGWLRETACGEEAEYLLPLLEEPDLPAEALDDTRLHTWCREELLKRTNVVKKPERPKVITIGRELSPSALAKVHWTEGDVDVAEALIEAIDLAPRIEWIEIAEYLQYAAMMVRASPEIIVQKLEKALARWLESPPQAKNSVFDRTMSMSGKGTGGPGVVLSGLAFFGAKMVLSGPRALDDQLAQWVMSQAFACPLEACGNMILLATVAATRLPDVAGVSLMGRVELLLVRVFQTPDAPPEEDSALGRSLRQVSGLLDSTGPCPIYQAPNQQAAKIFFDSLTRLIPQLDKYPNPNVRAAAARILRQWSEHGTMPNELEEIFDRFRQDARARVRYETRKHED